MSMTLSSPQFPGFPVRTNS